MDQASYLKNLSSTLFELSRANVLCDTTLIASDREFSAHSVILAAASPTLRSAFQNSPDVKNMYRLELHWLDGDTLENVLFLIYTGNLKPSDSSKDEDDSMNLIVTCEQLGLDWIWSQVDLTHKKQNEQESTVESQNKMAGGSCSSACQDRLLSDPSFKSQTISELKPIEQPHFNDTKESTDDFRDFDIDLVKHEGPVIAEQNSLNWSNAIKDGSMLETFVCEFCDKALPDVEQLNSHRRSCSSDHSVLTCGDCGRRFKYAAALQKHYKLHHAHSKPSPSVCHVCGLVCNELRTHLAEVHRETSELLGCDTCDAVFTDKAELENHFKVSHADEQNEKPFVCSQCWKSFREKSQLKKHLLVHESQKDFVCELCSRSFAQEYYLKKHLRTHSDTLDHACPTCGKRFKLFDYLRVHLKGHCGGGETEDPRGLTATAVGRQPHACFVCNRTFTHLSYLKKHMRIHTGEKPYECVTCKKRFKDNCLQQHMLTHSTERPYACQKCSRRFLRHADLQAHVRTHSGTKSHWCTHCVQGFHKKGDLHRHLRVHTGERPYICETCGKSFKILFHLTLHAAVHSNDRPHKCDKCGRAFPSAVRLKKHAFIHTGERPYVCPVCSREFNRHANMKSHLKTHDEKPARPRGAATSENGDFVMISETRGSLAESLTRSENMEIVYCKMEQPEVLVALPMDTLQKYTL